MSDVRPHLWLSTDDPRRYFLVPREAELTAGDLEVRDLTFTTRRVDPAAVAPFEVDREAAQAHVDEGWSRVLGQARDTVREWLGQPPSDEPPDISLPFVGLTPGQVALDADKRRETRRSLLESLSALVGTPVDEASLGRFEERLDGLRENLMSDAEKAADDVSRALESGWDALKRAAGVAEEPAASSSDEPSSDPSSKEES